MRDQPVAADERFGPRRHARPAQPSDEARAERGQRADHHDDEGRELHRDAEAERAPPPPPATAPRLTNIEPKCGTETSTIAATKATPSQPSAVASNSHIERGCARL